MIISHGLRAASSKGGSLPVFVSSSVNRTSGISIVVTAPTGIQDGDLLVALSYTSNVSNITPPTGFNQIYNEQGANPYVTVSTKTASSESGDYTFTGTASSVSLTVAILVYRNATRVNALSGANRATSATATAPSVTPTYPGVLLASFSAASGGTISTPPSGMTQRVATGIAVFIAVYELSPQAASATGDKTLVWGSSVAVSGLQLQITNEPNVAPEFIASAQTQTANVTTITIAKPTGTVEGDLMVATVSADENAGRTYTPPSGWTEVADQNTGPNVCVAYKVAGSSEGDNYTFTISSSERMSGAILTYRYAAYDTIGTFTTGTDPLILPSVSPSESQSVLIATGARRAASVTLGTPIGMTARATDADGTIPSSIVCDQTVAKGPSGTRAMSTGSTSSVAGIMLAIKPTRSL